MVISRGSFSGRRPEIYSWYVSADDSDEPDHDTNDMGSDHE
jgi:hypothetical protein